MYTQIKSNINVEILPFGCALIKIQRNEIEEFDKSKREIFYSEPITTNTENVDIVFSE